MSELEPPYVNLRDTDPVLWRVIGELPDIDRCGWMAEVPPMVAHGALVCQAVGR